MNRNEAKQALEKLKAEAQKLEEFLAKPEEEKWPKFGDVYYGTDAYLVVWHCIWTGDQLDLNRKATGSVFRTEEEALAEARYRGAHQRLRALARELNEGWVADWTGKKSFNWIIVYDFEASKLVIWDFPLECISGGIYFKTYDLAELAISRISDEDKEILFGVKL